ncbi:hypothetical protein CISIN_1g043683mg [Citrus sinensis]|uniref:NB-ARC domain-containing protein n=1 Tax=Citrus sinensis TaxID=2711 RepID=A0A067D987_CITSI|nr:hypothetical protein CISIN_1g043683mg [Citrus sinensis]
MGWEIVRQESMNDLGKRSWLWHHEDSIKFLTSNAGRILIEGICLGMSKVKEIHLNPDTFRKMLRYFHWHGCPLKSLPSNIHLEKLVLLEMPHSNIQQLLDSVRGILTRTPNTPLGQHLNTLVLPENIGQLSSLGKLDLQKNNFERIPESVIQLSKLGRLCLRYWERLQSLPKLPCKLHELDAHHCTALESLSGLFSSFEARTQYFDLRILEDALQETQLLEAALWKEILVCLCSFGFCMKCILNQIHNTYSIKCWR